MTAEPSLNTLQVDEVRKLIVGIDAQVPVLGGMHRTYVNLDNAASTPCLSPVWEAVEEFLCWYSSVHRGTGFKSWLSTELYEHAHRVALDFVGADPARDAVIFGKNATDALNKLANRFPAEQGQVILSSLMEHHSNDLPWRGTRATVDYIGLLPDGALDLQDLERKLAKYKGCVALVAISGGSNVTGHINPIHMIAELAHAVGAMLLVDAAQLAPHRAIDMLSHDDPRHLDFLALSGHKMYAPFGTGALYGPRAIFELGAPDYVGGGTVDLVTLSSVKWAGLPDREEAGSPNVVGAIALAKSMEFLQAIGMPAVAAHEADLTAYALEGLLRIDGIHIYGSADPARAAERLGVIPVAVEGKRHALVACILSTEYGIGVRNGCFCAHPYVLRLLEIDDEEADQHRSELWSGIKANLPGLVRVSFGIYNNRAEVDLLLDALRAIVQDSYSGDYIMDPITGSFAPVGFAPDLRSYFAPLSVVPVQQPTVVRDEKEPHRPRSGSRASVMTRR